MHFVTTCLNWTTSAVKLILMEAYWWPLCAELPSSKYLAVSCGKWYPLCWSYSFLHKMLMALGALPMLSPVQPSLNLSRSRESSSAFHCILRMPVDIFQCWRKCDYGWLKQSWEVMALLWLSAPLSQTLSLCWCWRSKHSQRLGKRKSGFFFLPQDDLNVLAEKPAWLGQPGTVRQLCFSGCRFPTPWLTIATISHIFITSVC